MAFFASAPLSGSLPDEESHIWHVPSRDSRPKSRGRPGFQASQLHLTPINGVFPEFRHNLRVEGL
jgi:hypothetical protein